MNKGTIPTKLTDYNIYNEGEMLIGTNGEVTLPETGEICPYFAAPGQSGEIWVFQTCRDEKTGSAYMGCVRYVAEEPD